MRAIESTKLSPAWPLFEAEAKRRRRDPRRLLTDSMKACLQSWADADANEQMAAQTKASGLAETDAVRLVREHRAAKKSGAKAGL